LSLRLGSLVEPFGVIAGALGDYLRIDLYFASVIFFFALLYVPTIPRAVDNSTMLATATNDDPWLAMALDGSIQRPFGNPANYLDPELAAHKRIPPYWGALRYDGIIYYGGAVFMLATPVYAVARLLGCPPFPTVPIILRIVSVVGGLLSLIVLYNFAVRNGMRWAGLLASVYLMTDYQFGMWARMAHPDTLQVLFALFALVIGLRHAERGDLASLAALGLMCGFVQGAKSGGPWTVPMAFLALLWGLQAASHKFSAVKPLLGRCMVLGAAALFGYFVSTPYAFTDPYLLRSFSSMWQIQGLGASTDGPFGRVTISTWVQAIYAHIGPLAAALAGVAMVRSAFEVLRLPQSRPILLAAVLAVSQFVWYVGFGRYWVIVGYMVLAIGLAALLAYDTLIVAAQGLLQFALRSMRYNMNARLIASHIAVASVVGVSALLLMPRLLQNVTSTLLLASFELSTQVGVNGWAVQHQVPRTARILYDDLAYFDPNRFPNAKLRAVPTWGAIDAYKPEYLVLSQSISGAPHFQPLIKDQRLNRDDPLDFATGGYSVRVYQDLMAETFGPTGLPDIDYVAEIKALPIQYGQPNWSMPQISPLIDWALGSVWWSEFWLRASLAVIPRLFAPEPIEGPTFRVFRFKERPLRIRYAQSCNESEANCTDFKKRLMEGDRLVVAFDACPKDIGAIKCGGNYALKYWKEAGTWCSELSGPQVGVEGEVKVPRACHGNPEEGIISVFFAAFAYNRMGEVYYLATGRAPTLVGHLKAGP
jgi:4-amino-4-deoxy-L-arabinose transferase-like glycosyltransferase